MANNQPVRKQTRVLPNVVPTRANFSAQNSTPTGTVPAWFRAGGNPITGMSTSTVGRPTLFGGSN